MELVMPRTCSICTSTGKAPLLGTRVDSAQRSAQHIQRPLRLLLVALGPSLDRVANNVPTCNREIEIPSSERD